VGEEARQPVPRAARPPALLERPQTDRDLLGRIQREAGCSCEERLRAVVLCGAN